MKIRNIMTSPVFTVPPSTSVLEASKLMKEKKIERLPIAEGGVLLGMVTKDRILRAAPSAATSLSVHEINYLYDKLTVKDIMQKNVVAVHPDTTVEAAVRIAQDAKVGGLPVVEDGKIVGIITTNDLFYLVLNPVLGIGECGSRISIRKCNNITDIINTMTCVKNSGFTLTNAAYLPSRRGGENDLLIHVAEENAEKLVECLIQNNLEAESRER